MHNQRRQMDLQSICLSGPMAGGTSFCTSVWCQQRYKKLHLQCVVSSSIKEHCVNKQYVNVNSPSIASTVLSFSTSMEPEQTKQMACRASPWRMRNSPGAQKEVLIISERERRHPRLADSNRGSCRSSLFKCMAMSARSSSGKSFSSWKKEREFAFYCFISVHSHLLFFIASSI